MPKRMEEIRIAAPGPGCCAICATKHDPADPHDRNSLYYQNWFRKRNKRLPTWADAMAHCSPLTQAAWRDKLKKHGISVEEPADGQ